MSRRPMYEMFLVLVVIGLAIILSVGLYRGRVAAANSQQLMQELSLMRSGIILYKTVHRQNPSNLEALLEEKYDDGGGTRPFLEYLPRNERGEIADPFGNLYHYDEKTGWVKSVTSMHELW